MSLALTPFQKMKALDRSWLSSLSTVNIIITIVDVAFIAAAIVIMIMCRQIQEQEATLKVLHKEQAGVKVFFQQLLQHYVFYLYSPGPGLQAQR